MDFDRTTNTVRVRAWGFWSVRVANAFCETVVTECVLCPIGTTMVMDMNQLKPMRDEGQRSFAQIIAALQGLRIRSASIHTTSQLTKLQLLRIVAEQHGRNRVLFI